METHKRQHDIIDLLKENKFLSVNTLAEKLFIGAASIRRDLAKLERLGYIKRTHGGATLTSGLDSEIPLYVREETEIEEKNKIAELAVKLIHDTDIVILDSSSTTHRLVKYLSPNSKIKVITNSAKAAITLGEKNISVYSTGGMLRPFSYSFIGDTAKAFMKNFYGNILFFSCRAISQDLVLYDSSDNEAELRKVMMEQCDAKVLLCDSTKFNRNSFYKICDLSSIDYLITDKQPDDKFMIDAVNWGCKIIWE